MHKIFAFAENPRRAILVIILLGLAMFLPGFFTIPPIDRDEARFAQASKQMIETGDYLDIHFQKEVRYKKPVGIYWLQSASTKFFSASPYNEIWTYRIPSLLAAIGALVLTYLIGRTLFSAQVGFGAALLFSSSLILGAEARLAKTDATLLMLTLLAMWALAKVYMQSALFRWRQTGLVFWLAIAAGILVKGPVILMVLGLAVLTLCIIEKSPRLFLQLKPIRGLGIVALCVAPWLIAITLKSHGVFWAESVGHDMAGKIAGGQESHGQPFGTHTALLFILFLPAVVAVVRGIMHGWKTRAERTTQFLLAWILPCWLIFEIVPTKLPHYTLPMLPGIAILASAALSQTHFSERRMRLAFVIPVAVALALNVALLGIIAPSLPNFWVAPQMARIADGRRVVIAGYAEPSAVFLLGTETQGVADVASANDWLQKNPQGVGFIAQPDVQGPADFSGFNLGRGKMERFRIVEVKQ